MAALQMLGSLGLLHLFTTLLFWFLTLCFVARMILSWLPMLSPANPFVRFFINITAPLYDPIYRVLPRLSAGMFDLRATIAFIFSWWAVYVLLIALVSPALPPTW
jgi:uncharacterized protein YggT (Ycf19 family)